MQRIVKYPILLESLIKHLEKDSDEYKGVVEAIKESKAILNFVNIGMQRNFIYHLYKPSSLVSQQAYHSD